MAVKTQKENRQKRLHIEVVRQMVTLATSGFGLVAALAWNSFIQEIVNGYVKKFLPEGSGILSLFLYASIVTALAVIVTMQLSNVLEKVDSKK